jgi:hypothetical protein
MEKSNTYRSRKKSRRGKALEEAVARIQQLLDPGSTVTRNEKIKDRLGYPREFDVVVRGRLGTYPILVVIECRDWRGRLDVRHIEGFHAKADRVNANLAVIVSRKGFFARALKVAAELGFRRYRCCHKTCRIRHACRSSSIGTRSYGNGQPRR